MVKGKGKVVPVLFLTEHHAMKAYWRIEVKLHALFDLGA
jgi:hypothetical protein